MTSEQHAQQVGHEARAPAFWHVANGVYETPDGRYRMYRLPGGYAGRWCVEDTATPRVLVENERRKRDAQGRFEEAWRRGDA